MEVVKDVFDGGVRGPRAPTGTLNNEGGLPDIFSPCTPLDVSKSKGLSRGGAEWRRLSLVILMLLSPERCWVRRVGREFGGEFIDAIA